ncbi:glycosyltransferase [Desulfosporosinus sp. FKA]|uniref:glycosyltransferase n=1 Tax=Desulfosporosinus sp. FKA TaxID=1969834 RepID=UPI001FA877E3|nr:glycosyltransferase [Desulfosporosinus sp. FKA]
MMTMPKVSVIIPTYNYAQYVGIAVKSVLDQNYPNMEIFVVDDGSTDQTQEILMPFIPWIHYYYKDNGGTASALNFGLAVASGKYVCWLSSDDIFLADKVAKQVCLMEKEPALGFSYTSFVMIDGAGSKQYEVHSPFYSDQRVMVQKLMEGCFINGSSVMMRKSALDQVGYFDESMATVHDYELWFRMLRSYPCGFLDELLLGYRWHGRNGSLYVPANYTEPALKKAREFFPDL